MTRPTAVQTHLLEPDGPIPNNPRLPLLLYLGALDDALAAEALAREFEACFGANGWPPAWRDGVFAFHHYHSTAHEVLGIFRGEVQVQFGGPSGPALWLAPGDAVVIPAGVAHKRVASRGGRLGVVGAYPQGQSPDVCADGEGRANVLRVPLPAKDPLAGEAGPLRARWSADG